MKEQINKSTKDLIKERMKAIKDSASKFDLPIVNISECLFINCKYYNILI